MSDEMFSIIKNWWAVISIFLVIVVWVFSVGWRARRTITRFELLEGELKKQQRDIVYIVLAIYAIVEGMTKAGSNGNVLMAKNELLRHITENKYGWAQRQEDK